MSIDIQSKIGLSQDTASLYKLNAAKQTYDSTSNTRFIINEKEFENSLDDAKKKELDKLKKVSEDFEALFVNSMLKEMRKTVNKSDLLETNSGEQIFEDMLYDEYSKEFSKSKSLGVADIIYNNMKYYV